jgi:hypothetical protein
MGGQQPLSRGALMKFLLIIALIVIVAVVVVPALRRRGKGL